MGRVTAIDPAKQIAACSYCVNSTAADKAPTRRSRIDDVVGVQSSQVLPPGLANRDKITRMPAELIVCVPHR